MFPSFVEFTKFIDIKVMVLEITATHEQERLIKEMLLAMSISFNNAYDLSNTTRSFEVGEESYRLGESLQDCLGMWKDNEYQDFASFRKAAWGGRGVK